MKCEPRIVVNLFLGFGKNWASSSYKIVLVKETSACTHNWFFCHPQNPQTGKRWEDHVMWLLIDLSSTKLSIYLIKEGLAWNHQNDYYFFAEICKRFCFIVQKPRTQKYKSIRSLCTNSSHSYVIHVLSSMFKYYPMLELITYIIESF